MDSPDNYTLIMQACKAHRKVVVELKDKSGVKEVARFAISTQGGLIRMLKGSSRRGEYVYSLWLDAFAVRFIIDRRKLMSPVDRYADKLRKWSAYVIKHRHPNVWEELETDALKVTDERIYQFCSDLANKESSHDVWEAARSYELPRIEAYKTLTLTSCKLPSYMSDVPDRITKAMDKKEWFSFHWTSNYDYHASGEFGGDGLYRAWLSQEFKGCGNGHYWLLLNGNNAIFCEDD